MMWRTYPSLRHRPYRLLWFGLIVSNMGTWMQNVAQSWLIYKMTNNDAHYLGWLGLAFAVPMILLPAFGGVLADRVPKARILRITQWSMATIAGIQAALTLTGLNTPALILTTTFVSAVLLAVDNPTRQALIPTLVPREDLLNALALNAASYNGAALLGPAIAGFLMGWMGAGWLFAVNTLSFLAVIYAVSQMPAEAEHTAHPPTPLRDAVLGGIRYARGHALTGVLLVTSSVLSLFGRSYQQVLPIYADDIWHISTQGYGIMLSAAGAGAMIGALGLASLPAITPNGSNLRRAGVLFAALLAIFAWTPIWWVGVVVLLCIGVISTAATTMIATMLQLAVPGHLRGRVMSLHAITLIGVPSVGGLVVTQLTTLLGAGADERSVNASGAPLALLVGAACVALLFVVVRIPGGASEVDTTHTPR